MLTDSPSHTVSSRTAASLCLNFEADESLPYSADAESNIQALSSPDTGKGASLNLTVGTDKLDSLSFYVPTTSLISRKLWSPQLRRKRAVEQTLQPPNKKPGLTRNRRRSSAPSCFRLLAISHQFTQNNNSQLSKNVVLRFVNTTAVTRNPEHSYNGVPSSIQSTPFAVASQQQCPRTFNSSSNQNDLAAFHGLPAKLPPLPSLSSRFINHHPQLQLTPQHPNLNQSSDSITSFVALPPSIPKPLSLSPQESSIVDNTMHATLPQQHQTVAPAPASAEPPLDLESMLEEIVQGSPTPKDSSTMENLPAFPAFANAFDHQFLTSPLFDSDFDITSPVFGMGQPDFGTSSPLTDVDLTSPLLVDSPNARDNGSEINLPIVDSQTSRTPVLIMDSSPLLADYSPQLQTPASAFGLITTPFIADESGYFPDSTMGATSASAGIKPTATELNSTKEARTSMPSPTTSSSESPGPVPLPQSEPAVPRRPRKQNRRVIATGTRRNLTPASLLPVDAPTQSRQYSLPSVTSRKEVPLTFARKRAATAAASVEPDDELPDLPPDASEKEQIEWKRRQNTIAARKSRKRKLEHQQWLEGELERLTSLAEKWKHRAETLRSVIQASGDQFLEDWDNDE